MKNDRQKQQREEWRKIVEEYQNSDMKQKAFCEKHNLNISQFVYYHGQFKRKNEPSTVKPSFVPVKISRDEKSVATSEIKLLLPNGFQCIFLSHTDTLQIKRLVEVLLSC